MTSTETVFNPGDTVYVDSDCLTHRFAGQVEAHIVGPGIPSELLLAEHPEATSWWTVDNPHQCHQNRPRVYAAEEIDRDPEVRCEGCNDVVDPDYRVWVSSGWMCSACLVGAPPELGLGCAACWAKANNPAAFGACSEFCWGPDDHRR